VCSRNLADRHVVAGEERDIVAHLDGRRLRLREHLLPGLAHHPGARCAEVLGGPVDQAVAALAHILDERAFEKVES
jgi:hypothetical protein